MLFKKSSWVYQEHKRIPKETAAETGQNTKSSALAPHMKKGAPEEWNDPARLCKGADAVHAVPLPKLFLVEQFLEGLLELVLSQHLTKFARWALLQSCGHDKMPLDGDMSDPKGLTSRGGSWAGILESAKAST